MRAIFSKIGRGSEADLQEIAAELVIYIGNTWPYKP